MGGGFAFPAASPDGRRGILGHGGLAMGRKPDGRKRVGRKPIDRESAGAKPDDRPTAPPRSPATSSLEAAAPADGDAREARVPFPIVGIGASAGGLEAAQELLRNLPLDTGMAFVVVQHLDPTHASMLTEILGRSTDMPVSEVKHQMAVGPNRVYVIPPGTDMVLA